MMDKKNKIILMTLAIITFLVALLGATFAYFSAISRSKPQIITTSSLSLSLKIEGATHVTNIKPTVWSATLSDNEANTDIVKIPFSVTSPAGVKGTYDVDMSTNIPSNGTLTGGSANDVKYKLYKGTTMVKEGSFSASFNEQIISGSEIVENTVLNDSYKLYVYIENKNEEQNTLQNIDITINLTASATQTD